MGIIEATTEFMGEKNKHNTKGEAHTCKSCRKEARAFIVDHWFKQDAVHRKLTMEYLKSRKEVEVIKLIKDEIGI